MGSESVEGLRWMSRVKENSSLTCASANQCRYGNSNEAILNEILSKVLS